MKRVLTVLLVLFLVGCTANVEDVSEGNVTLPTVQQVDIPVRYENGAYSVEGFKHERNGLPSGLVMLQGYVYDKHNCYCPPGIECAPCYASVGISDDMGSGSFVSVDINGAYPDVDVGEYVRITAEFTEVSADLPLGHVVLKKIETVS